MEIHTEGPTSVLDSRQRGDTTHTHAFTLTTLSLSLSRAGVPVANHRAAERGSCMTLTLRYTKTWRSSPVGSLQTREGRGDGNNAMKQKTIEY